MNKCIKEIIKYIVLFVILGVVLYRFIIFQTNNYKDNNTIEPSVEIQKHNDSLKFKVNNLDSIKNAKVLEVEVLNDDSTISLFYNLIK